MGNLHEETSNTLTQVFGLKKKKKETQDNKNSKLWYSWYHCKDSNSTCGICSPQASPRF